MCGIVLLSPWDCIASLLVRVCVDQIYTQDGRLIAVTSQESVVRADVREPERQTVSDIGMPFSNLSAKL